MFQIRLTPGGPWHRRARDRATHTVCGELITGAFGSRDHDLDTNLCPICFTRQEIDTGKMNKLERDLEDDYPSLYFDEDDEPTDPNGDPDG